MAGWSRSSLSDDELEKQNQTSADNLAHKVSRLKSLAYDVETESKEHNHLLDGLGFDFESNHGLLSGSANRMNKLLNNGPGNRKIMCFVCAGTVIVFLVSYYLIFRINR